MPGTPLRGRGQPAAPTPHWTKPSGRSQHSSASSAPEGSEEQDRASGGRYADMFQLFMYFSSLHKPYTVFKPTNESSSNRAGFSHCDRVQRFHEAD